MRLHKIVATVVVIGCASASLAQERLTVDQAVAMALKSNYRLRSTETRAGISHDNAWSAGSRLLPSVRLSEEYQHWNCPFAISFATFTGACLGDLVGQGIGGMTPSVIRGENTNTFVASVNQPLLGLLHSSYEFSAQRQNAKATDAGVHVSRAALVQGVRTLYLQYFEARALEQIAGASVSELAEQVKVAQARMRAGVITNADLLRVQVALANARQQQVAARAQGRVSKANLLDAIGLRPDENVELVEPTTLLDVAARPLPDKGAATLEAERQRPEVKQARYGAGATKSAKTSRFLTLLPEIDAEGGYIRTDGQLFAPANQWFVGAKATWAIWEWGATYFQARAASRQAEAAEIDLENQRRTVAVEVQNAIEVSEAASVLVDVSQQAISSAQEAYRVMQALVQAGSATTTDLLDSQSALTTARLNLARAHYELAIERVALTRAMGD